MDIDKVDMWRQGQHKTLNELRDKAVPDISDTGYIDEFKNGVDDALKQFLAENGLDASHREYQEIFEMYRQASVDRVHEAEWLTSPASRGKDAADRASGRDKLAQHIQSMNTADMEGEENERETTLEKLIKTREAKHIAYVARLKGALFGEKRRKNDLVYKEAEEKYREALGKQLEERIAELHNEGKTDDEIKQFLKEQANDFARGDEIAQKAILLEKTGPLGKLLEHYANASRGKKLLYGLGLGAAAAVTGVGAGLVMGAALGAAGGAALAGLAATGSGLAWKGFGAFRTYHLRRADIFRNHNLPDFELNENATLEGERRRMLSFLQETSDNQLKEGERIKKRAMVFAVGSVAVGTTVGMGVHAALEGGDWSHWWGGLGQHAPEHPAGSGSSSGPSLDNPNLGGNGGKVDVPETPEPSPPTEPESVPSRGEIIQDYIAERGAAQKIRPGEGLFQTLKELGVPAEHRREFMEKYGEKLIKKFPQAFYRMPNGETGILMTENGKMPRKALEYMVSKADKSNWIELPEPSVATAEQVSFHEVVPAETTAEQLSASGVTPTEITAEHLIASSEVVPANSVGSRGEYLMSTLEELRRAGVIDVSPDRHYELMQKVGPRLWRLRYEDGTPVATLGRPGSRWYLNSSPDGRLHPQAIREIERYARQSSYGLAA